MRDIKGLVLVASLVMPAITYAHNGVEHIKGTVTAISAQGLTVETTDKTEAKIRFDDKTKFQKNGSASSAQELHPGERVVVNAVKKRGSGELFAALVKFGSEQGAAHGEATRVLPLAVTADGFMPSRVRATKNEPLSLVITRKTDTTCATAIAIPDYGIQRVLPLNEAVTVTFTPNKSGEIKYTCAMGMVGGVLVVE